VHNGVLGIEVDTAAVSHDSPIVLAYLRKGVAILKVALCQIDCAFAISWCEDGRLPRICEGTITVRRAQLESPLLLLPLVVLLVLLLLVCPVILGVPLVLLVRPVILVPRILFVRGVLPVHQILKPFLVLLSGLDQP
jgi:hypothetical protein